MARQRQLVPPALVSPPGRPAPSKARAGRFIARFVPPRTRSSISSEERPGSSGQGGCERTSGPLPSPPAVSSGAWRNAHLRARARGRSPGGPSWLPGREAIKTRCSGLSSTAKGALGPRADSPATLADVIRPEPRPSRIPSWLRETAIASEVASMPVASLSPRCRHEPRVVTIAPRVASLRRPRRGRPRTTTWSCRNSGLCAGFPLTSEILRINHARFPPPGRWSLPTRRTRDYRGLPATHDQICDPTPKPRAFLDFA